MADDKKTKLSIIIQTVDEATAKIKAINERLDETTKPVRDFKKQLGELAEKSGLSSVAEGFKGVGEAVKETLFKFLEMAAVIGETVHLLLELVEHFEDLGKKAERIGVGVDFLAGMRDAAERSGASVETLDAGLQAFTTSLGQARAGTGRMKAFLDRVNPAFERQILAAKTTEEALDDLADGMSRLTDPAERLALAQKTLGNSDLAQVFARGGEGLKELREHYAKLAPGQAEAAAEAIEVGESMKDLKAATDGVKAALVTGLGPALKIVVDQLKEWLVGHQADIKKWAEDIGKKLPGAVNAVVAVIKSAVGDVLEFVDAIGGWKTAAVALAAVILGPLISSIVALGIALLTTPVGWIVLGIAAIVAAFYGVYKALEAFGKLIAYVAFKIYEHWGGIKDFFSGLWDGIKAVFEKAWEFIKDIVDKVIAAVDSIKDAVGSVGKSISIDDITAQVRAQRGDVSDQSRGAIAAGSSSTEAKVTVDFANAPRGTRVRTDPQSTADVDLSVGYQMIGAQ